GRSYRPKGENPVPMTGLERNSRLASFNIAIRPLEILFMSRPLEILFMSGLGAALSGIRLPDPLSDGKACLIAEATYATSFVTLCPSRVFAVPSGRPTAIATKIRTLRRQR